MDYPIIIDGRQCGTVSVFRQGLYTVFRARAKMRRELLRLSVYGGGREGLLGVMQPQGQSLYLERRLSRAALQGFPQRIEYAGRAGERQPPKREDADILWHRMPNGSLYAWHKGRRLTALPVSTGTPFRTRWIEGREYAVFYY